MKLFGKKKEDESTLLKKIEVYPGFALSKAIADKWPEIKKTERAFIKIDAAPNDNISAMDSHFGSYPFLPKNFAYPEDENGKPMLPLAQLNFSAMPSLPGYPQKGILQFYIRNSDSYGLDFDDQFNQQSFRVVYFEDIEGVEQQDVSFLKELMNSDNLPFTKPHKLSFSLSKEYIGIGDVNNDSADSFNVLAYVEKFPSIQKQLETEIYNTFSPIGHKVGGYAYFTQSDPREHKSELKDYLLLFQMDSDGDIMWGDVGVGNFFIHPDNLAKKDFSKVMYNWDCC